MAPFAGEPIVSNSEIFQKIKVLVVLTRSMFLFGLSRFFAFVLMIWCRFTFFVFTKFMNFVYHETVDDGSDDVSVCSFEVIRASEESSVVDDASENLDVDASEESLVVASSSDDSDSDFTSCEFCSKGRLLRDAHHYPFCSECWYNQF